MSSGQSQIGHSVIAGLAIASVGASIPETWMTMGGKILFAAAVGAVGGLFHRMFSDLYGVLKQKLTNRKQ